MWVRALSFAAGVLLSVPLHTQTVYHVDEAHSMIAFQVRYLVGRTGGSFSKFKGKIILDEKQLASSQVEVVVEAASINTNNDARDQHLRGSDFFDTGKFPTLSFKSIVVKEVKKGVLDVTGDFTMKGVTRRITVPVKALGDAVNPRTGTPMVAFSTSFTLKRKDFGIDYGLADAANVVVGNEVTVEMTLLAAKEDAKK